jgi:hypothetical protein
MREHKTVNGFNRGRYVRENEERGGRLHTNWARTKSLEKLIRHPGSSGMGNGRQEQIDQVEGGNITLPTENRRYSPHLAEVSGCGKGAKIERQWGHGYPAGLELNLGNFGE